jgi:hypothetical protein
MIMYWRVSLQRSCWHVLGSVMESTPAPTQSSCPSGTDRFFYDIPGTSCQATLMSPSGTISRRAITINLALIGRGLRRAQSSRSRLRPCYPLLRRTGRGAIVPPPRNDGGRPSRGT